MGMRKAEVTAVPTVIPVTVVEETKGVVDAPMQCAVPVVAVVEAPAKPKKAVAYGRELSEYELHKDRRIGVAGIAQAVIESPTYGRMAALMDEDKINGFLVEQVKFWLETVKQLSEK